MRRSSVLSVSLAREKHRLPNMDKAPVSRVECQIARIWLLVPQSEPGMPHIDGVTLPVISAANWARLTDTWLANAHRAGTRPIGRMSVGR